MASWRDSTSQSVQDDLDTLVGIALDAAQSLLAQDGELYPFGVSQDDEGVSLAAGYDEALGDRPSSQDVLALLLGGLRDARDRLRATAVVAPVIVQGADAIRVEVEHRDGGPALEVLLPYHVGRLRKKVTVGDVSASEASRQIWPDPQ